jgi:hypothetical protein
MRMSVARFALAAMLAASAWPANANDSTASLDTGGLRLTYNPDIKMEAEDLYLSRAEVRVRYRFLNTGARDIATLVAFPLPVMEIGETANYALEGRNPVDIMGFELTADGQRLAPSVEIKATRFGVDVTAVLKRHGIPVTMLPGPGETHEALQQRLDGLSEDARRELERYGLVDWTTSFGAQNKPLANVHWETHIAYYWFQTFPAGRAIEVSHKYKPVPRDFLFVKSDLNPETRKTYCVDDAFARAAQARLAKAPNNTLAGYELKYVLTTAGNWQGAIDKFTLTVEKPSPDALVSLCATGIKRTGPTTFSLTADKYSPDKDLNILFVDVLKN